MANSMTCTIPKDTSFFDVVDTVVKAVDEVDTDAVEEEDDSLLVLDEIATSYGCCWSSSELRVLPEASESKSMRLTRRGWTDAPALLQREVTLRGKCSSIEAAMQK
jgi:hypothetical protein